MGTGVRRLHSLTAGGARTGYLSDGISSPVGGASQAWDVTPRPHRPPPGSVTLVPTLARKVERTRRQIVGRLHKETLGAWVTTEHRADALPP